MSDNEKLLDTTAVAALVKVGVPTIRVYLKRTRARIAEGLPIRDQDFPLPDETFGQSPTWKPATIQTWLAARPGSGRRPAE
jgi:predicted DNA-binding transcriptional regulator AlpA